MLNWLRGGRGRYSWLGEGWEKLSGRIKEGFEAIAKEMEEQGGGKP